MATTVAAPAKGSKSGKLAAYRAARRRGVEWLLRQLGPDGALGDPAEGFLFYRAPWTFAVCGETDAAAAVCGWIRRNMRTADGKIEGPYRVFDDAYGYRNSALIVGAQLCGQYDLSLGLMPDLLSWQDPLSGAFANDRTPDGGKSDDMDIPYACGPGFACLATGNLDAARRVAAFLKRIYDAQTELPDRFFYTWSRSKQAPITKYPDAERSRYVVENQVARPQRWTIGGIAAGFLCRLYLAEPKPVYLALARRYQEFSMSATERQFEFRQVTKSGWGSSLLYEITFEERYLRWSYRMGDWLVNGQRADGPWVYEDSTTPGAVIERTLERVMHLDTIIGALASRP